MVPQRQRFVNLQIAWLGTNVLLVAVVPSVGLESFFISSFAGFLAITVLTAPSSVSLPWRAPLKWFVGLGLVGFGYIAFRRILSLLPPELL